MAVRLGHAVAAGSLASPAPGSGSVRRLLFRSHDDPARQRILTWLLAIDDARLLRFGLTPEDIAVLRATARPATRALPELASQPVAAAANNSYALEKTHGRA